MVRRQLTDSFAEAHNVYTERGFSGRLGFGRQPALLHIDLANAWTSPDGPFACDNMQGVISGARELNAIAHRQGLPVVYTTTVFDIPQGQHSDAGLWQYKIPTEHLARGSEGVAIDPRLELEQSDLMVEKKKASALHGTHLASLLTVSRVDTLIITGVTASGCVRHTAEDAISAGFRPIVVSDCVSDRIPGATGWNLFDIAAKFGDVVSLEEAQHYLEDTIAADVT